MTHPQPAVKTPVGDAPVVPLFLLGTGMYLAWFGVHYWRSDVKYPTDPVKAVLQGKQLPDHQATDTAEEKNVSAASQAGAGIVAAGPGPTSANAVTGNQSAGVTPGTGSAAANQNTGKLLAAAYGWSSGQNWDDLVKLWNQESGWNNQAENPSSGAYGIPQALPYSKMPKAAWPPRYGGKADPTSQISWGLSYIKGRYGSPSAAWAHEVANNWY
jgi:hypothetical protein